jgi:hypothetical protein
MKRALPVVVLGLAALASASRAQERPPQDGAAPVGSQTAAVDSHAVTNMERLLLNPQLSRAGSGPRDPFGTTERMRDRAADLAGAPRFVPNGSSAIPKLSLRGYVEPKGKPPAALIEIEGQGVYVVRAGDTIGIAILGKSSVLKVQAIEASSARVEAGSLGQVIVVR